jgi:hypothetical protein
LRGLYGPPEAGDRVGQGRAEPSSEGIGCAGRFPPLAGQPSSIDDTRACGRTVLLLEETVDSLGGIFLPLREKVRRID